MNIGKSLDKEDIKKEFDQVSEIIGNISSEIDSGTILWVTGNKAYDLSKSSKSKTSIPEPGFEVVNFEDNTKPKETKSLYTGLFLYTNRKPQYLYDYSSEQTLNAICPNPKKSNKISSTENEQKFKETNTTDKSGVKKVDLNDASKLLTIMNTLNSKILLKKDMQSLCLLKYDIEKF